MKKGNRIRYSDKNLLFNFCLKNLVLIFLLVLLVFYIGDILSFDCSDLSFNKISNAVQDADLSYLLIAVVSAALVCGICSILFYMFGKNKIRQLRHRQALARMVVENGWYESETKNGEGLFGKTSKEVVTWFPKLYYRFKDSRIYLLVEVTMGRAQDNYLNLNKKIETGLFCEFIEFSPKEPYYQYVFYYDLANTRLNINDLRVENGGIELMQGFVWKFDKLPHALIVGGTGSGKTYMILVLIKALVDSNAVVNVLDPKNADLADLAEVMPNVYHKREDIIACIDKFAEDMLRRSEQMKKMPNYKTGNNYAALGLEPHFLVFDEYVAFMDMLSYKQNEPVMSKLKQIVMLGRQAGYFLILACQRPDAKYLADGIRDQFHFRVALGRNSELGYKMIFGEVDKKFLTMPRGRGYSDMGTSVISEFYVPFVPEEYDFLKEIGKSTHYRLQPGLAVEDDKPDDEEFDL